MKKFFLSILVLLLIVVGASFVLPLLLTSDAVREEFAKRISSISGMDIALNGPVNLSVFPDLGLVADRVKLSAPDNSFSLSAEKMIARVKIAPLFSGKLEITGLEIRQPEIFVDASVPKSASTAEDSAPANENSDIFADAVNTLESLALNQLTISDGKFISLAADGSETIVESINAELSAPSLDGEMKLVASAISNGQKTSLNATLAALRPILQNKPSKINIGLKMVPAPHPALADLSLSGVILLAADGSYQISNGQFSTLGQPLRLDAVYKPGERPYGSLVLQADSVDLGVIEKVVSSGEANSSSNAKTSNANPSTVEPDLSALRGFDGDLSVSIGSFAMDGAKITNIDLRATLNQGVLKMKLGNATIAKGKVTAGISTNLNEAKPTVRGSLSVSSLGLTDIARLANTKIPLKGNLAANLGYAFRGLSEKAIKDSFNVAGNVTLSRGSLSIPALSDAGLGRTAGTFSRLNVRAKIDNIQKPVSINGDMAWLGEVIKFTTKVSPQSFVKNKNGPVAFSLTSSKLKADFNGNLNLSGAVNGKAKVSTASLGALMSWLGQGANPDLKGFSFSGNISADASKFEFDKSKIVMNGNQATGSGSLKFSGKPSIVTNLSFGSLDIAALTGGGSTGSSSGGGSSNASFDLSALRGFDADINLRAKKLSYGKVTAGPVNTKLTVKKGVARFSLPQTGFYGGNVTAEIVANGAGEVADISIDAKMAGVNAAPLYRDAADFDRIEGTLNSSLSIQGAGKTTKALASSLSGNVSAKFTNGAIKGIDVAKIYNNLPAVLASGFKENSEDRTEFAELSLSYVITNGVAVTDDVKLIGPLVRMSGAGNINLGEETIDMRLNPRLVGISADSSVPSELSELQIPIIIKGPLSKPKVYPDLTEIIKNPQAALSALSKLGLNIKGLGNGIGGANGLDIVKIAKDKLNLDSLNNPEAVKQVGTLIEALVPGAGGGANLNTNDLVGSLLGNLIKPGASPNPTGGALPNTSGTLEGVTPSSGAIAIPSLNPLKKPGSIASVPVAPAPVVQQIQVPKNTNDVKKIVDDVINPKTDASRKARDEQINNLLKKLF